ncbi:DUF5703 family protein [Demequina lignilytica]|uniref:DUF5703 family protein n=1 Tax=Demequina lignilytica TaxID=3051663 RepID=A0AAW7M6I6_9MICO|nr:MULTISPECIES: DUF5703 family protein [unclassified Demequina]MDN4479049.1 DUF5703 family protein [Demequina sp. SYSU T00039-1]MDN4484349.1 DUF5703 family protein [Demequina sp. SYSU T0a273]MDN4489032.1 DUF5703 family protein [Demequina sp. SYSU T00039]MDN4491257.1 DUF5703 family protein [Demequina sp. SYSU T00068]
MNPGQHVPAHVVVPTRGTASADSRYEWRVVDIARDVSRSEARAVLTEQAEYGRWDLVRSQLFYGGARRVWLRRRVMNVRRTDDAA